MEDICIVCADSLEYCAYGKCGHKEMCHRCSARLRFLGEDTKCPLCNQEIEVAMVTKFMGEQTLVLPPETLDQLAHIRKRTNKYHYLPSIQTFYDEYETFQDVRELCSLQHPVLDMYEGEDEIPRFRGLRDLKNFIKDNFKLHFCDLCLKNRKAFVCEQVLYPEKKLKLHYKEGDKEGPLAETGFTGHPMCQWCRNRFYNEDMHYQHMERDHFHCNICRRNDPRKYVYFNKYDDLEEHFKAQHFLCPIQECLDQKFIVFETEPELKRHLAQNHAEQLGMGKTDRRAAMTIPVEFNFSGSNRRGQNQHGGMEVNFGRGRGGGAHSRNNINNQYYQQYDRQRNMQDREQLQEAMRLSMLDTTGADDNNFDFGVNNTEEDFPALGGGEDGRGGLGATWARSGNSSAASLTDQDFPSLPGQSKNAKKHARQKARRQEEQQKQQQQPQQSQQQYQQQHQQQRPISSSNNVQRAAQEEAFPSLPSSSARPTVAQNQEWKNTRNSANGNVQNSSSNRSSNNVQKQQQQSQISSRNQQARQGPNQEDFPGLGGNKKGGQQRVPLNSQWGAKPTVASKQQVRVLKPAQPKPVSAEEAFPSLGQAQEKQKMKFTKQPPSRPSNATSSSSYSHVLKQDVKLSKNMQYINESLVGKIQERLDDDLIEFFRIESSDFLSHEIDASEFHAKLAVLGIVDLVPEFAAMLHNTDLRESLLDCHEQLPYSIDQWNELSEDSKYRIGSPEQLQQESEVSRRVHAWQCPECKMVNGSADLTCEDCGLKQTVARSMIIAAEGAGKSRTPRPPSGISKSHISGQNAWKKPTIGYSAPVSRQQQKPSGSMAQKLAAVKNQLENPRR